MNPTSKRIVTGLLQELWTRDRDDELDLLLPRTWRSFVDFYGTLQGFLSDVREGVEGKVSSKALIRGHLAYVGHGAVIEAGAIIHRSARLFLGQRSRIKAGTVIRDEVIIGADCTIGVNCEVVRCLVTGPRTNIAHLAFVADSVLGAEINVAGNTIVANTPAKSGGTIFLRINGEKIDSTRSHLGMIVGDGVRFGASTTVCPGTIIFPDLALPPSVTLLGTIDRTRRPQLLTAFFRRWDDTR